ncbi:MAG TPA: sugar phosphate isomerase/epimerase [Mesorhizobium sp.]|jgi:sugar phosphate isomerase/epimerase|nr:sugar phosphate isomerase/epimerase [Mesorhizobium sp.]
MDWSFQLYSARNFQPWDKVLDLLGRLGYRQVEGFAGVYGDLAGLKAGMDRNGLAMPTGHLSLDMLESDFDGARRIADALGIKTMICPHITADQRPDDAAGWRGFGERLAKVDEKAKAGGYDFAWHNHDFEFAALPDGSLPMTHILEGAPEIGWEIDVAWVVKGGGEPSTWIEKWGDRILAVHVKDIAQPGQGLDEDGWSDVGHGTLPWRDLVQELRGWSRARFFIMEQDNPNDIERFARRSIEAARNF